MRTVLSPYRSLLTIPGVRPFVVGAFLARVGGAMFGVAVIVMVSSRRDSYGLAGAVSAVGLLVLAGAGPLIGRLIDKHGQRRVARPFVFVSTTAGAVCVACSLLGAPTWTLFVSYGVSAFLPEMGPLTRARWAHILRDEPDRLHTAMSFEQVADEAGFVIGPVVAVALATAVLPEAGLIAAFVLFAVGTLVVLASRDTEPVVVPHEDRPHGMALRRPGLGLLAVALTMTGVIFGANEVVAVGVADAAGRKSFSSVILALFALGSMVAGLLYGARQFRQSLVRRLAITAAGMFVLEVPVLLVRDLWGLALVMLVAGSATAPMLITAMTLTQRILPPALVTEGMAVVVTGILVGISLGTAVGGWAVEHLGPHQAYAVPVVAGAVAVAVVVLGRRTLVRAERVLPQ
jgi:MFS family permease